MVIFLNSIRPSNKIKNFKDLIIFILSYQIIISLILAKTIFAKPICHQMKFFIIKFLYYLIKKIYIFKLLILKSLFFKI